MKPANNSYIYISLRLYNLLERKMSNNLGAGPSTKIRSSNCVKCNVPIRKTQKYLKDLRIISSRQDARDFRDKYGFHVQENDVVCSRCFTSFRQARFRQLRIGGKKSSVVNEGRLNILNPPEKKTVPQLREPSKSSSSLLTDSEDLSSSQSQKSSSSVYIAEEVIHPPTVCMSFNRVSINKNACFICHSKDDLHDVPFKARLQVFQKKFIFVPKRMRCCSKHLIGKLFFEDELTAIRIFSRECEIEVSEVERFLEQLSIDVDTRVIDKIGTMKMSDEKVKSLTGHIWLDILQLRDMLTSMRDSDNRNVLQALIIFLFKMRTGNSDLTIASIMEVTEKIVNDSVHSVLKCFEKDVLPKYFGVQAHSRQFFLENKAPIADLLHGSCEDRLFVICDGTYLRHEKSSNNAYQRKSYSGQKKVPLCKPFTICTTNGFTIDAPGPFNGTMNDAEILRAVLADPNGISSILRPGDVFVLDRGFRDVIADLEGEGYTVLMPSFKGKKNQLTTKESNYSRFVTILRWVIEAVHGIIGQKYKLLHHQFRNNLLKDAGTYTRVAYFLVNTFCQRLNVSNDRSNVIADRMKLQNKEVNTLAEEIEASNLNRKTVPYKTICSSDLLDLPKLEIGELELLFTGSYQVGQTVSYLGEMLDEDGTLSLKFVKDKPEIVRFEVRSRHINAKTYKCYVKYVMNGSGIDAIEGYCCNCANGLRTVGCCSHVASLIYHLSYGRYLSRIFRPAEVLTNLFDLNNVCPVIDEDSEED